MSEHDAAPGVNPKIQGSVDPRLWGGQPIHPHGFSRAQIEAFVAVCDTFIPSLSMDEYLASTEGLPGSTKALPKNELQVLDDFLHLSASDANLPLEAAGLMTKLLKRSQVWLVHLALWMLATRFGTLILGGKHAIISTFPFIGNFASLPQHKRQKLMFALSQSCIYSKQELFRFFKSFVCWSMLTKVDAFAGNPMFEVIKYQVGEEEDICKEKIASREEVSVKLEKIPLVKGKVPTFKKEDVPMKEDAKIKDADVIENGKRNMHALTLRVVDANVAGVRLGDELAQLGVARLADVSHLEALRRRRRRTKSGEEDAVVGIKCDVVIAGSGPGGAVVAAKLAREGYRVVVVEKGGYYPVGTYSQLEGPSLYAMYEEGGCLVTDDSRMLLLAGATVGGGSTVNWAASFCTPGHVCKEWAQAFQLDLFSSPAYEHAMHAVCSRLGVQSHVAHENFCNSVLRAGCTSLGFHVDNIPRNSPPNHQCGFCGLGCQQGKKQGAMLTWLEDAAQAGAVLISSCNAEEVLSSWTNQKRRKVAGLVARAVGTGVTLYVEADVVVSACGALRTPSLLRQSGLRNSAIGKNLHIHPVQLVWGHFEEGCEPAGVSYRGGIMTAFSNVAGNWDTSGYGALIQCPATQPGFAAIGMPWISGLDFKTRLQKFARTAFFIVLARDQGSGQVSVDVDGRLCVRYQLHDVDKESLRNGAEQGLRILKAAGACQVGTYNSDGETYVVRKDATSDSFEAYLGRVRDRSFQKLSTLTVSAHQMGSCRMGTHPSRSAVRPNGETWEVDGLFVSDSSVFPTATGVNPMVTVQSIAYCTADSILTHLKQKLHSKEASVLRVS